MLRDVTGRLGSLANIHPELRGVLLDIDENQRTMLRILGRDGIVDATGFLTSAVTPPTAKFTVTGRDGFFIVDITNPQNVPPASVKVLKRRVGQDQNQLGVRIVHQLRSSTVLTFDAAGTTTEYEPTEKTHWDIQLPNQRLYWQLRSSYDGKTWNDWAHFVNPSVCGVQLINSSVLRTSSNDWLNSGATTTTGASPLSQSGVTTTILVAASTWKVGDQTIAFNAGSVNPGAFGRYYVYCLDINKQGGAVTYLTTLTPSDLTAQNGLVFFGIITTSGGGGGTGGGGGGGYDPGSGCYGMAVPARMYDGSVKLHGALAVSEVLRGIDGGPETILAIDYEVKPCFTCEFDTGLIIDRVSSEQMWLYEGGGWDKVFDVLVGDGFTINTATDGSIVRGRAKLIRRDYAGDFLVVKLRLDRSRTYWIASEHGDLGSHNMNKN